MVIFCIIAGILILNSTCIIGMFLQLKEHAPISLNGRDKIKLIFSGMIAFIADAIGLGSFAVNIAMAKLFKTCSDEELPAMINGAQVIPGTIESLFFMQFVHVDLSTLFTLVAGTCLGGLFGGRLVSQLSQQAVRVAMICCFILIMSLLLSKQLNLFPMAGSVVLLREWSLVFGFFGMMLCGALTSVGIGLFVMVQGVLFLLNVSPVVAFPIMMTAGAMQQPLTTLVFLRQRKIPLKKTLLLSLGGCIGIAIILPMFHLFSVGSLHMLLFCIVTYNLISVSRDYWRTRTRTRTQTPQLLSD